MAVKLADTAKPMANFPIAEAVDIDVNINGSAKRLQQAIDDGDIGGGGSTDYDDLTNKPQINSVELTGNKTLADLGIASTQDIDDVNDKFMDSMAINNATRTLDITYKDGSTYTLSLEAFIQAVVSTIGYGKAIRCDDEPSCTLNADGKYEVTYTQDGNTYTTSAENTWFYYQDTSSTNWVQTLYVDGHGITIEAGGISDVISIDTTSKNWLINGVDTGIRAEGYTPVITENADNDNASFRLDIDDGKGNVTTTPNLRGRDSVQVPLNGFYAVYIENGSLICEVEDDATPPPLSLENGYLYYTVGGEIKYVSVEDV